MCNIEKLTTESINEATRNIDRLESLDIVTLINNEDKKVAEAIEKVLPQIAEAVESIVERFKRGGRIIYCGAGSSGRMGTLDAVELTPTYSVSPTRAFGLLAGGDEAMYTAVEGAEDSEELAVEDLKRVKLTADDCVIGIAASGRTPYTKAALEFGKQTGAFTISVTCNQDSAMAKIADISIAPVVGPEVINGSTRMKAGTAQKMVVNMLSTGAMIRLGKVYQNYMVHVQPTNEKLVKRAVKMIIELTGAKEELALKVLYEADKDVAVAIVMIECSCSKNQAREALLESGGQVREAIAAVNNGV
ncbi:MAG TPA: N-acetylmuramic acid 6-phosphate etherase [Lachnoclostridium sp.]|jgi:N-acetylmuramic acid 6-phosphate etherase|nr:N-acetylmuramic acid 6-phosphate etherase [Lachnoclostridium sp.]